ncbi:MAG: nucleotidyltransferase substrate binding protein [Deltaproteobacteria bacterium]|nr:nucleotidyltransferase substrate binding protein [Deltaproteobacteria bacterium]
MKTKTTQQSLENFKKALESLKNAVLKSSLSELELAGAIQNFEFCYELLWKTLQKHASTLGRRIITPREAFQFAHQAGLIEDEKLWLNMIEDRNETVHTYDQTNAEHVYQEIKNRYFPAFLDIFKKLSDLLS